MIRKEQLNKMTNFLWEIPQSYREDMRVPARVYATEEGLEAILKDDSLDQLINVSTLPGIQKAAIAMPDAHQGYGFPIGGVAATKYPEGVISPGGIGYDINCGVRLLATDADYNEIKGEMENLATELYNNVPAGAGKSGPVNLNRQDFDRLLRRGAEWAVENGYGGSEDLEYIEANGRLDHADPNVVSERAKQRGQDQAGTLGGGNHFLEVDRVSKIFNQKAAQALGLHENQVVVFIHTGSRGFGHQVATDYVKKFQSKMNEYGINLPDRGLACAPMDTRDGKDYYHAMAAGANFAWCNRQVITSEVRKAFRNVLGTQAGKIDVVYDISHNIAKLEVHEINGNSEKVMVHRKGATRAFGPGHPELPDAYRDIGQPVFIPGSMGTSSYVLTGTTEGMQSTFGSTCHGAGRNMSRTAAKKQVDPNKLIRRLKEQDIHIQAASHSGVAEEAPLAYKEVDMVVETVEKAGIAKRVLQMHPAAVIKG
ncbi:RtcB family protein [Balneolaceae bacterium YR4-1]|uniref:tRNA-splicing ligase RtcB n=1 Tax=Halalkalibaculum roseum TaxID=2709311 RepID=A0A6M1SUA3_9BACT|nr:RtcB family protein [Halalkalibaculum roseum]NGP76520.1 RtcB family protein [Halalkalibaculum roseum]